MYARLINLTLMLPNYAVWLLTSSRNLCLHRLQTLILFNEFNTFFFDKHCETTTAFSPPNIWSSDFFRSGGKLFGELIDRKIVFRHKCQGVSKESFLTLTTNLYFPCVSLVSSRLSFTHLTLLFRPPLCQHSTNFEKRL